MGYAFYWYLMMYFICNVKSKSKMRWRNNEILNHVSFDFCISTLSELFHYDSVLKLVYVSVRPRSDGSSLPVNTRAKDSAVTSMADT